MEPGYADRCARAEPGSAPGRQPPGGRAGAPGPAFSFALGRCPRFRRAPRPGVPGAGRAGPRSAAPTLASTGRPLVVGVAVAFSVCQLQSLPGLFPGVSVLGGSGLGPRAALRWHPGPRRPPSLASRSSGATRPGFGLSPVGWSFPTRRVSGARRACARDAVRPRVQPLPGCVWTQNLFLLFVTAEMQTALSKRCGEV